MATKKALGNLIDKLYDLKQDKSKAKKKVDDIQKKISALQDKLFDKFEKSDLEGAMGGHAKVSINRITVAQVTDWGKVHKYVIENDSWDLMRKQLNDGAFRERLEDKIKIPGTKPFIRVTLSVTKRAKN